MKSISYRHYLAISATCLLGWALFIALFWVGRDRIFSKITRAFIGQDARISASLAARIEHIRGVPWADERPTVLFLGDSHMEMGRWYDFFNGRYAIQNAGLSQAKVKDVLDIAGAFGGRRFGGVVIMCGINDLGSGVSVEECLKYQEALLGEVMGMAPADRVVVLSVLPVLAKPMDSQAAGINRKVPELNAGLRDICQRTGTRFLDVVPDLASGGNLVESVTWDGLHLNDRGYRILARRLDVAIHAIYPEISTESGHR